MSPEIYHKKISNLQSQLQEQERINSRFTWSRSMTFLLFAGSIYAYFQFEQPGFFWLVPVVLFFVFLKLVGLNTKVKQKVKLLKQLIKVNQIEIDYLNRNLATLDKGDNYENSDHFFAYDLDIFGYNSIFQHINRTALSEGADKLAEWLENPLFNIQEIKNRQEAVLELKSKIDFRQHYLAIGQLNQLEKKKLTTNIPLDHKFFQSKNFYYIFILPVITVSLLVLSFFDIVPSGYGYGMMAVQLIVTYLFGRKLQTADVGLSEFAKQLSPYIKLIQLIDNQSFKTNNLQTYKASLFNENQNALVAFQQLSKILNSFEQRLSPIYIILGNGVFLIDLYLLKRVDSWFAQNGRHLDSWMKPLAEINALNSLANFTMNHPTFVLPTFTKNDLVEAKNLGHPLIPVSKSVTNDFSINNLHEIFIVTGANMAGKSTFLRTVGINVILASIGSPVCASEFQFQPIHLFTSMRTTDNLSEETSYFHAELLRLKKLVETVEANPNEKYVIILDEILKGTNSKDKLMGSILFLEKLLQYPISGLIATHDLELGKLSEKHPENFRNICFEIEIKNDDVVYDYKLRSGVTQNFNATFLLGKMGLR